MERIGRHLSDKYRPPELIVAAGRPEPKAAQLAELYLERCYRLVDEDYAAMADLDSKIERPQARPEPRPHRFARSVEELGSDEKVGFKETSFGLACPARSGPACIAMVAPSEELFSNRKN